MRLVEAAAELRDAVEQLRFPDVAYVYDPLAYAWQPHERYLMKYGKAPGRAVFIGMNPGPWGMAQTGVPFADVAWAHGWIGIIGDVGQPRRAHPKRPVLGYRSTQSDPSGRKFYGWAKARFGTADRFFERFFVTNYCPLLFLDADGRNIPVAQLRKADIDRLAPACDAWLADALGILAPRAILPMGNFVEARVRRVAQEAGIKAEIVPVIHPSPANPLNNAGWAAAGLLERF